MKKLCRCYYLHALIAYEGLEMEITAHYVFCQSLDGGSNDHVVFRIVRHGCDH